MSEKEKEVVEKLKKQFLRCRISTRVIFLEKLRIWQKKVIRNVATAEMSKHERFTNFQ